MTPDEIVAAYNELEPALQETRKRLEDQVQRVAKSIGIEKPRVDSRVKDLDSLLLKVHRKEVDGEPWADPMVEASDKIGVRVDVVHLHEVDELTDALVAERGLFEDEPEVDDKRLSSLGADKLGYQGVHVDVVPRDRPEELRAELAKCEIQIRTNAQSAWAMATHDLTYKGGVQDDWLKRRVNRLTALLELVDEGIRDARETILNSGNYPLATLIDTLTRARVRFTTRTSDRELTHSVIVRLVEPEQAVDLVPRVEHFVEDRSDRLADVLTRDVDPVVRQPESILAFMLLEEDVTGTQERWIEVGLPNGVLERLALEWSVTFPTPL